MTKPPKYKGAATRKYLGWLLGVPVIRDERRAFKSGRGWSWPSEEYSHGSSVWIVTHEKKGSPCN